MGLSVAVGVEMVMHHSRHPSRRLSSEASEWESNLVVSTAAPRLLVL